MLANVIIVEDLSLLLICFQKGKLSLYYIIDASLLWLINVGIRDEVTSCNGQCLSSFFYFLIFVFCLKLFSFFRLSIPVNRLGVDRFGFCICNPVRSARLVFCCAMLLL